MINCTDKFAQIWIVHFEIEEVGFKVSNHLLGAGRVPSSKPRSASDPLAVQRKTTPSDFSIAS